MKKRIRTGQARLGMFVEELEGPGGGRGFECGFLIVSSVQLTRIQKSNVISLVINTARGTDISRTPSGDMNPAAFEAKLHTKFSGEEIHSARSIINETTPLIREVFDESRLSGAVSIGKVEVAVEQIMSTAENSAAAVIAISRLKTKDEHTYLHSLGVSALMVSFARKLELDHGAVRNIAIGGLVHDVGKAAIPDSILSSTNKLTLDEMTVVKDHPRRGYQMLKKLQDVPIAALHICRYHHERYDGSGYPLGLAGDTIPFEARLAAICDVYEALTTVRPYKHGWTQAEAVDMMLRSGGHFDPGLLSKFISKMVLSGVLA